MGIYRGAGGSGDAVNDAASEALITVQAKNDALAAQAAAEAAQTAAELAETNAEIAEANAAASAAAAASFTPSQTGNAGKYLKTDGTNPSWDSIEINTADITGTLPVANGGTGATTASVARTNLGLGSIATQNSNSVSITGGSISGITDLAVADGGTGASDAATARSNLGLVIGTNVQAWDADLDTWATKTPPSGTAVGTSDSQTLTNKTIALGSNTVSGTLAQFNTAVIDADFVSLAGSETLTNKTLTNPTINGFTGDTSVINIGSGQIYKDATGLVGLGTTTPVHALHVNNSGTNTVRILSQNSIASVYMSTEGGGSARVWGTPSSGQAFRVGTSNSTNLVFVTGGADRVHLTSGGVLGVDTDTGVFVTTGVTTATAKVAISSVGDDALNLISQGSPTLDFSKSTSPSYLFRFAAVRGVMTSTTPGGEAGDISFLTSSSGGVSTEKFRITSAGNINITGTGARITGDFSNATLANRVAFQTSTTNGNTNISVIPNGTATRSNLILFNSADPANSSFLQLQIQDSTSANISSVATGTGTFLPLTFQTNGFERLRIDTSGNVGIGLAGGAAAGKFEVGGGRSWFTANSEPYSVAFRYNSGTGVMYMGATNSVSTPSIQFSNSGGAALATIDYNGNVGIGTTPISKLTINGNFITLNDGAYVGYLGKGNNVVSGGASSDLGLSTQQNLVFGTGGSLLERMRITSGGDLFIGASSAVWDEKTSIRLASSGAGTVGLGVYSVSTSYTSSLIRVQAENGTGANFKLYEGRGAGGSVNYWVDGAGTGYFAGNVGIGTSSPSYVLHVSKAQGSAAVQSTTTTNSTYLAFINGGGTSYVGVDNSTGGVFSSGAYGMTLFNAANSATTFFTNAQERMRIDSSGNVGIGATPNTGTFNRELTLSSGSGQFCGFTIQNTTTGTSGGFAAYINNTLALLYNRSNDALLLGTNNQERMRITSGGNLLVGATAVGTNANYFAMDVSSKTAYIGHNNGTTTGTSYVIFQYNGTSIADIAQNGTTAVSYNTTSDYRLKENIAPMTGALAKVSQLKPVTYNWKVDGSAGQGFIAHELQAVCPDAVSGKKDDVDAEGKPVYQGVDTSFLVATLTAAIQEQQAMIEELKQEVALLKAK